MNTTNIVQIVAGVPVELSLIASNTIEIEFTHYDLKSQNGVKRHIELKPDSRGIIGSTKLIIDQVIEGLRNGKITGVAKTPIRAWYYFSLQAPLSRFFLQEGSEIAWSVKLNHK